MARWIALLLGVGALVACLVIAFATQRPSASELSSERARTSAASEAPSTVPRAGSEREAAALQAAHATQSAALLDLDFVADNLDATRQRAADGDPAATLAISRMAVLCYVEGAHRGCSAFRQKISRADALPFIASAAERGDASAQLRYYAVASRVLEETPPDRYAEVKQQIVGPSLRFLTAATHAGNAEAMQSLGLLYDNGRFAPHDPEKAYVYMLAGAWRVPGREAMTVDALETRPSLVSYRREVRSERVSSLQAEARQLASCCDG